MTDTDDDMQDQLSEHSSSNLETFNFDSDFNSFNSSANIRDEHSDKVGNENSLMIGDIHWKKGHQLFAKVNNQSSYTPSVKDGEEHLSDCDIYTSLSSSGSDKLDNKETLNSSRFTSNEQKESDVTFQQDTDLPQPDKKYHQNGLKDSELTVRGSQDDITPVDKQQAQKRLHYVAALTQSQVPDVQKDDGISTFAEFEKYLLRLRDHERSAVHPLTVFLDKCPIKGPDSIQIKQLLRRLYARMERNDDDTSKERGELVSKIRRLQSGVHNFISLAEELRNSKGTSLPIHNTEQTLAKVQAVMDKIEEGISGFKQKQMLRYERLLHDETIFSREIDAAQRHFRLWKEQDADRLHRLRAQQHHRKLRKLEAAGHVASHLAPQPSQNRPPEIDEYHKFVASHGGHHGGWNVYDHNVFLRLRRQHKAKKPEFVEAVSAALLGKSIEDVNIHEQWYAQLCASKRRYKEAITVWRRAEKNEKEKATLELQEHDIEESAELIAQRKEREIARKEQQNRKAKAVAQWRQEQEEKRKQEEAKAKQRAAEEEARKIQEKEAYRRAVKREVSIFQQAREHEERVRREAEAERKRLEKLASQPTANDLQLLRERDAQIIHERREKQRQALEAEKVRQKRLEALRDKVARNIHVSRDPDRIFRLNESAKNRLNDRSKPQGQLITRHPPKLGIPSWRRGL